MAYWKHDDTEGIIAPRMEYWHVLGEPLPPPTGHRYTHTGENHKPLPVDPRA